MPAPLASTTTLVQASSLLCNQDFPEMVCRISFQGATQADPLTWVDFSSRLRSFQIESGGANELEGIDTGTATVVLDDRVRDLDPFNTSSAYSPNVKPRRRLWLQSYWAGECKDQFYGWTGSFQPGWVGNTDAVVTVEAQDGLSVLSRSHLPVTNPPRDTYADLVLVDKPYLYLRCNEAPGSVAVGDSSGNGSSSGAVYTGGGGARPTFGNPCLLTGDTDTCVHWGTFGGLFNFAPVDLSIANATGSGNGDLFSATAVAMDGWVKCDSGSGGPSLAGPTTTNAGPDNFQYGINVSSAPKVVAYLSTTTANYKLTGASTLLIDTVYHIGMRWDGANLKVYLNGVEDGTMAAVGSLQALNATGILQLGADDAYGQHFAIYPGLTVARLQEHYRAGRAGGLGISTVSERLNGLLDNSSGYRYIPRRVRTDATTIQQTYFNGQVVRSEIDRALPVAGDPSMFFMAKDGAAVFLDSGHRSVSPWDTVQATFDDDGTDLKYLDVSPDDGQAFIRNVVRGTARPVTQTGDLQSVSDTTSISDFGESVHDLGETLYQVEADLATEVAALLAKYKDPIPRVTTISLHGSHNTGQVASQIFNRELGDKVRVFRRPVGGGSAIDQSSWIRRRTVSGDSSDRWPRATWALSSRGG